MENHSDNTLKARKGFWDKLGAVRAAIGLCTASALFTRCILRSYTVTAFVNHNSIHKLSHKRCLNLVAILMSTREPQSDTCQEHLLRFSHGLKKKKKKNMHLFLFRFAVYNQR